jgi:hypothetical protein
MSEARGSDELSRQGRVTDDQAEALSRALSANWGMLTSMCGAAGVDVMVTAGADAGEQIGLITGEAARALHAAFLEQGLDADVAAVFAAAGIEIVPAIDPTTGLPPGVDPTLFRSIVACAEVYARAAAAVVDMRQRGIALRADAETFAGSTYVPWGENRTDLLAKADRMITDPVAAVWGRDDDGQVKTPSRWPLPDDPFAPSNDPAVNLRKANVLLDRAAQMTQLPR